MTHLSDRLNEVKDAGLRIGPAVRAAQEAGHDIDRGTVYRYLAGNHAKDPEDTTLEALEAVFGVPVTELRELAGKPPGELDPYKPPAFANRLNNQQRKALNELIRTIVETTDTPLSKKEDVRSETLPEGVSELPKRGTKIGTGREAARRKRPKSQP